MALGPNELFRQTTRAAAKRFVSEHIAPKKFAAAAGGPTLAQLTPVAYDTVTNNWKVWANAGANGIAVIRGFIAEYTGATLDATNETLHNVIMAGTIYAQDVVLPGGETQANLDALLTTVMRDKGFTIQGPITTGAAGGIR